MKRPTTHYLVQFAARYSGGIFDTLNAASALIRATELFDDIIAFKDLVKEGEEAGAFYGDRLVGYEIISYYAVGLATCLEWHARSRLVDSMIFDPNIIGPSDLKNIATLALSQMVAEGITVPQLLGA